MSRKLASLKMISEKLSGIPFGKEYRILQQLKEKIDEYEKEIILKNFLLDYDVALDEVSMALCINDTPMFHRYKTFYLVAPPLEFSKDLNDEVEVFAVLPPRKRITIGVCVYEKKEKNLATDSFQDKNFVSQYGKIKLVECEWCNPSPKRNEELSKFIHLIEKSIKLSFRKEEDGLYTTTLPYVNSFNEFKKQLMPKIKSIFDILAKWD